MEEKEVGNYGCDSNLRIVMVKMGKERMVARHFPGKHRLPSQTYCEAITACNWLDCIQLPILALFN